VSPVVTPHTGAQPALFPPEAVEITLTLGLVGATDHMQLMFSVKNAIDGVLLELESVPHRHTNQLEGELDVWFTRFLHTALAHLVPF